MKKHNWVIQEMDNGYLGINCFWECSECGAGGGFVFDGDKEPRMKPFYPDGSGLKLRKDCDKSKSRIEEHLRKKNEKQS